VSPAGGGSPTAVPGTVGGSRPVFSPGGQTIAFDRERIRSRKTRGGRQVTVYQSVSVWLADLATGRSRRLTAWHNGLSTVADSFSPDGSTLSVTRQKGTGSAPEVVLMKIDGSGSSVLAVEAEDGVYSPDGSQIAYLNLREHSVSGHRGGHAFVRVEQTTDLFTTRVDGTDTRQLTNTPGSIEAWPSWDPSGKRLAFTRLRGGSLNGLLGVGDAIAEVNADGTCATTVLSVRGASLFGAAWQPGPGREAGPIVC
jgi:Tol biopolymer transport system component